jgi:hypothetical protein
MGNTPNNNFPYPESTGLVKDGWEDIKDLATSIDTKLGVYVASSPGLVKINTTSFSAVSAVNFATATFSSTYDNYYFTIYGVSSADTAIRCRMRVAGANETGANYNQMADARNPSTGGIGNYTSLINTNQWSIGATKTGGFAINATLMQPFASQRTTINSVDIYDAEMNITTGVYKGTTSYDAMGFYLDTGTMTGTYSIYGLAK